MKCEFTPQELGQRLWLIGDSLPRKWIIESSEYDKLQLEPLDPRHPTRHNILTPVLDYLQSRVYQERGLRLDIKKCLLFNAFENRVDGQPNRTWEDSSVKLRIQCWTENFSEYNPLIAITFGADSYRFAAKALNIREPLRREETRHLGELFQKAARDWQPKGTNLFPLLHTFVARQPWKASEYYTGHKNANYFKYVGEALADILLKHERDLPIWHTPPAMSS